MKPPKPFSSTEPSSETIIQQMNEGLYDLSLPSDALYAQLAQALIDEHQRAIDMKEQEVIDLLRSVMANAHLILTLANSDKYTPITTTHASSPQTIRALIHKREQLEKKHE